MPDGSRAHPQMTASSPNVATNSLKSWAPSERTRWEAKNTGSENITCAAATSLFAWLSPFHRGARDLAQ